MIWDMIQPSIAIHHEVSHRITPKHQAKTTSTTTDHHVAGLLLFWLLVSPRSLPGLPPALFLLSLCCPSAGHIIGLTVPPVSTNLVPSRLGLLPQCMIVLVPIFYFPSFSLFPSCYIYRTISVSRYPKNLDIDIETRRKYENIA